MLRIYGLINCLIALHFWLITVADCFFFNQLFTTLENNIFCIFFFNNLFLVYNKQYVMVNYSNIYINVHNVTNQNLLNGSMNIHPIFFLVLINFIIMRYFQMYRHNKKYLLKEIFFFFNFYLYFSSLFFMFLGIYWASQELLWGLWWSWDLVEIFLLIVVIMLIIYDHFLKINSITDFYFFRYMLIFLLLFFFFNKLNIATSLHSFGSINSDNYLVYIMYTAVIIIFVKYNNYVYVIILLGFFLKNLFFYFLTFILLLNNTKLYFISLLLIQPYFFIIVQLLFLFSFKHILILSSLFYWLSSTQGYFHIIKYLEYLNITQNFLIINYDINYNVGFELFYNIKLNILFYFLKDLCTYCLNNFFFVKFFLIFIFLFIFIKKYNKKLFY